MPKNNFNNDDFAKIQEAFRQKVDIVEKWLKDKEDRKNDIIFKPIKDMEVVKDFEEKIKTMKKLHIFYLKAAHECTEDVLCIAPVKLNTQKNYLFNILAKNNAKKDGFADKLCKVNDILEYYNKTKEFVDGITSDIEGRRKYLESYILDQKKEE